MQHDGINLGQATETTFLVVLTDYVFIRKLLSLDRLLFVLRNADTDLPPCRILTFYNNRQAAITKAITV